MNKRERNVVAWVQRIVAMLLYGVALTLLGSCSATAPADDQYVTSRPASGISIGFVNGASDRATGEHRAAMGAPPCTSAATVALASHAEGQRAAL